jgi:hypothetical protein
LGYAGKNRGIDYSRCFAFPTELDSETAWQVYSHVRMRLGLKAAEEVQRMLDEKGAAHISGTDGAGTHFVFDIQPSR